MSRKVPVEVPNQIELRAGMARCDCPGRPHETSMAFEVTFRFAERSDVTIWLDAERAASLAHVLGLAVGMPTSAMNDGTRDPPPESLYG